MEILIKLYGVFRIGRFTEAPLDFPSGSNVQVVVDSLELSPDLLGIVLINGIHADVERVLESGDTLSLLPVLDGG
jgi:molybdopterin synthase sulfur carrier subunit